MSKLDKILSLAVSHVPFYYYLKDKKDINITDFPIVNRDHFMMNIEELINDKYSVYDLNYMYKYETSGTSTGIPLIFYWNHENYMRSVYSIWKIRKDYYKIFPRDKYVTFHTNSINNANNSQFFFKNKFNCLSLSVSNCNDDILFKYYKLINEFEPKWIQFIPSFSLRFMDFMKKNNLNFFKTIKYIEFFGETLSNEVRNLFKDYNVVIANMYGSNENNTIAFELPCGHMHILEDNVYVECVDNEIIITNLNNTLMPIIRYNIGDKSSIIDNNCELNKSPYFTDIIARDNVKFIYNGNKISEFDLGRIFDNINLKINHVIKQYKININNKINLILYIDKERNGWKKL